LFGVVEEQLQVFFRKNLCLLASHFSTRSLFDSHDSSASWRADATGVEANGQPMDAYAAGYFLISILQSM
jgi:hypothetical protein